MHPGMLTEHQDLNSSFDIGDKSELDKNYSTSQHNIMRRDLASVSSHSQIRKRGIVIGNEH